MKRIYIAAPFTGDVDANCARAIDAAEEVLRAGFLPFVPHLYRAWDARHAGPYEQWMALCFAEIDRCDALLRLPGASAGADREVVYAIERRLPVVRCVGDLLDLAMREGWELADWRKVG